MIALAASALPAAPWDVMCLNISRCTAGQPLKCKAASTNAIVQGLTVCSPHSPHCAARQTWSCKVLGLVQDYLSQHAAELRTLAAALEQAQMQLTLITRAVQRCRPGRARCWAWCRTICRSMQLSCAPWRPLLSRRRPLQQVLSHLLVVSLLHLTPWLASAHERKVPCLLGGSSWTLKPRSFKQILRASKQV